jgi:WD40 repeat protein
MLHGMQEKFPPLIVKLDQKTITLTPTHHCHLNDPNSNISDMYASWHPTSPLFFTNASDLRLRCGNTGELKKIINTNRSHAPLIFNPNGSRVIHQSIQKIKHNAKETKNIIVYNGVTGDYIKNLKQENGTSDIITFSPDGLQIIHSITTHSDNRSDIIMYDAMTGGQLQSVRIEHIINTLQFQNNTEFMVGCNEAPDKKNLLIFDQKIDPMGYLAGNKGTISSITFNNDYSQFITGSSIETTKKKIRNYVLLRKNNNETILSLNTKKQRILDVSFNPNGHSIAATTSGDSIIIWNIADGSIKKIIKNEKMSFNDKGISFAQLIFNPTHLLLIVACRNTIFIYDAQAYAHLITLNNTRFLALSPDGTKMATENTDNVLGYDLMIWKLSTINHNINAQ